MFLSPLRWPFAAAGAFGGLTAAVALANPFRHHLTPPCPFHALTGLWCPLCGGTRAVWAAAHGQWGLMIHANALAPAIIGCLGWLWLGWAGRVTGRWHVPVPKGRGALAVLAIALVAFTVLRNFAWSSVLAPPASA